MQMVMIIIGGYVVASTPIVYRAIRALAAIPKTPRGAVALVALFSMLTSLISWGLSLIFSGLFVRELAHRVKGMDYRAAGAAAYLGLGAVWAMGLVFFRRHADGDQIRHAAVALQHQRTDPAHPNSFLVAKHRHHGHPDRAVGADRLRVHAVAGERPNRRILRHPIRAHSLQPGAPKRKPGEWLEYSPLLTILVALLLCWYLIDVFRTSPQGALAALDLNTYNLMFITVGLLLHWRPKVFCAP